MSIEIKTPVFPESISEGTIASWHKKEGDHVEVGEVIVEIETDKVVMEVPAVESGVIGKIKKPEGDTVISEEVIGALHPSGEDIVTSKVSTPTKPKIESSDEIIDLKAPTFPESISEGTLAVWHKKPGDKITEGDLVVEIETDKVMMEVPSTITGILTDSLKQAGDTVLSNEIIAKLGYGDVTSSSVTLDVKVEKSSSDTNLGPSARRAVKEQNIDAEKVTGTGKGGRVTKQDVSSYVEENIISDKGQIANLNQSTATDTKDILDTSDRSEKRVRMTRLRQTIAKRLVDVQQSNAILTTFNEVDMKPVMDIRKRYKDLFAKTHDVKLGFMSFFIKAATEALKRFPEVNASIDGDEVVYHGFFDIGIAVGSDRGLVVPVIRNTAQKSFADIESTLVEKAIKARDGKLSLEEMQGGTFTITNGGTYGSMLSTPIINSPQSAILGMHNIVDRPVVQDGEIVIRPIMYLALSYDHRIIDGSLSVRFLKTIKELIEEPARILLDV